MHTPESSPGLPPNRETTADPLVTSGETIAETSANLPSNRGTSRGIAGIYPSSRQNIPETSPSLPPNRENTAEMSTISPCQQANNTRISPRLPPNTSLGRGGGFRSNDLPAGKLHPKPHLVCPQAGKLQPKLPFRRLDDDEICQMYKYMIK